MPRPTRDNILIRTAYVWEDMSTCDRNHVGCVIALDHRIIATGYNGAPAGMPHCDHTCTCTGYRDAAEGRPHAGICPQVTPCPITVHAEANAIVFAARHGVKLQGATLYTTLLPCYRCAQLIINAGLIRVVFDRMYRDTTGLKLMQTAGIEISE